MFLGGNNVADVAVNAHIRTMEQMPPGVRPTYVAYPPPDSPEVSRYMAKCCTQRAWARGDHNVVFVGQVPRLLPLQYIPWALDLLLEEYGTRWVLQTQPNGCAKAWFDDDAHCGALVERNKMMLFDVCGLWVARTTAQRDAMMQYQASLQSCGPLDGRVPRHGVIVEKLRPPQSVVRQTLHQQEQMMRAQGITPGMGGGGGGAFPAPVPTASFGLHGHGQQQQQQHSGSVAGGFVPLRGGAAPFGGSNPNAPSFTPGSGYTPSPNAHLPAHHDPFSQYGTPGAAKASYSASNNNDTSNESFPVPLAGGSSHHGAIGAPRPVDGDDATSGGGLNLSAPAFAPPGAY